MCRQASAHADSRRQKAEEQADKESELVENDEQEAKAKSEQTAADDEQDEEKKEREVEAAQKLSRHNEAQLQQAQQELIAGQGKLDMTLADAEQDKATAAERKKDERTAQDGAALMFWGF